MASVLSDRTPADRTPADAAQTAPERQASPERQTPPRTPPRTPPQGLFAALEGGEGMGKTTLARTLAARLRADGLTVTTTREPGGSDGGEAIRGLLVSGEPGRWDALTETLLLTAARRDHVQRVIRPALARGDVVLCDRFVDSTRAYQGAAGGAPRAFIDALHQEAVGLEPDLALILDAPPALGLDRGKPGAENRFERFGADFHHRLRAGYRALAAEDPTRRRLIDATRPAEAVAAAALERIRAVLAQRESG